MSPEIPDKIYFSIGEASRIAEVEPHVLRYWESEFSCLRPRKDKAGRRNYRKKDLETILHIKDLLYCQRYSIAGAKKKMRGREERNQKSGEKDLTLTLQRIRSDLQSLLKILSR